MGSGEVTVVFTCAQIPVYIYWAIVQLSLSRIEWRLFVDLGVGNRRDLHSNAPPKSNPRKLPLNHSKPESNPCTYHWNHLNQNHLNKPKSKQECIPVGCVPSASVAVTGEGVSAWGVSARGCLPSRVSARHPLLDRMTDMCKNNALPQLRYGR